MQEPYMKQKFESLKQGYIKVKEFEANNLNAIESLSVAVDFTDAEILSRTSHEVLAEVVGIGLYAYRVIEMLRNDFLDTGLRELLILDPNLNNNGKMSETYQNSLAIKLINEKVELAKSYIGSFDGADLSVEIPKFLNTLNGKQLRQIFQITIDLYLMMKNLITLTVEDFLLQCKEELGFSFEKI